MIKTFKQYINEATNQKLVTNNTPENFSELVTIIKAEIEAMRDGHLDLNHINISRVEKLAHLFLDIENCEKIKSLDVSGWDVSRIGNDLMEGVFMNLTDCVEINVTGWKFNNSVNSLRRMFERCKKLERIIGLEDWDVSNISDMTGMFAHCDSIEVAPISKWSSKRLLNTSMMFLGCRSLVEPNVYNLNFSHITDLSGMFGGCESLRTLDCSRMDVRHVKDIVGMFNRCVRLQSLPGFENWDLSHVSDFSNMFLDCESLQTLDCSRMDASHVSSMAFMFSNCRNLRSLPGIEKWDVSRVINFCGTFENCNVLKCNISNWNISDDEDMYIYSMLSGADSIECSWANQKHGRWR